jgi:hypothetical protein
MTALTADQLTAIEFYQENLSYVEGFGLANLEREDRLMFRKGKKLIEDALAVKEKAERIPFTEAEILPVLEEYLASYSDDGQVKVFDRHRAAVGMASHRNDPIASAMGLHGQIVFMDNANDTIVKSFDRMGKVLKGLLAEYNTANGVDRFKV